MTFESVGFQMDTQTINAWKKRDGDEENIRRQEAIKFLKTARDKSNPVQRVGGQWKVLPAWREQMTNELLRDPSSEIGRRVTPPDKFPKDTRGKECMHGYLQETSFSLRRSFLDQVVL